MKNLVYPTPYNDIINAIQFCVCMCVFVAEASIIYMFLHTGLKKEDYIKLNKPDDHDDHEKDERDGDDSGDDRVDVKEESCEEEPTLPACPDVKVHLTPFELEGLWQLLHKLEELPAHKKCVPAGIRNAPALLSDIRVHTSGPSCLIVIDENVWNTALHKDHLFIAIIHLNANYSSEVNSTQYN